MEVPYSSAAIWVNSWLTLPRALNVPICTSASLLHTRWHKTALVNCCVQVTVEQSSSLLLRQVQRFVASRVSVAIEKLQSFLQTRSALRAGCSLPNLGFYGRLTSNGCLLRIELQHGGTIDRISLVSQSGASEHRRYTSALHAQIYNMAESETGGGKTPRKKAHPLGCVLFRG